MKKFKDHWEIKHNWQLIFPFLGLFILLYSSFRLISFFLTDLHITFITFLSIMVFAVLLEFFLFLFKKLENRWKTDYKWEMISIFMVFAITGSASVFVSRPIIAFMGITKENLSPVAYWTFYIVIGFIFYQILLVFMGWLCGQFKFFWNFEKKMLRRLGLKRFID